MIEGLRPGFIRDLCKAAQELIANNVAKRWETLATAAISKSFRDAYIKAITKETPDDEQHRFRVYIPPTAMIAMMMEMGFGGPGKGHIGGTGYYDMKKFDFKPNLKRTDKEGNTFVNIPMGKSEGQVLSYAQIVNNPSLFGKTNPRDKYNRLQKSILQDPWPESITEHKRPNALKAGLVPKIRPVDVKVKDTNGKAITLSAHVTDPLAGAQRGGVASYSQKADGSAIIQTSDHDFKVFRRMYLTGPKASSGKWMHRPFEAKHLAKRLLLDRVVETEVDKATTQIAVQVLAELRRVGVL